MGMVWKSKACVACHGAKCFMKGLYMHVSKEHIACLAINVHGVVTPFRRLVVSHVVSQGVVARSFSKPAQPALAGEKLDYVVAFGREGRGVVQPRDQQQKAEKSLSLPRKTLHYMASRSLTCVMLTLREMQGAFGTLSAMSLLIAKSTCSSMAVWRRDVAKHTLQA